MKRLVLGVCVLAGAVVLFARPLHGEDAPVHVVPASESLVVALCDGETTMEVVGKRKGDELSRAEAQAVSDALMTTWRKKNPKAFWDDVPKVAQAQQGKPTPQMPAESQSKPTRQAPKQPGQAPGESAETGAKQVPKEREVNIQDGTTYGNFSDRDDVIWKRSAEAFVKEGHRVFHDAKAIGGTIGVSCDMCHPDASNTHPETYPKYQTQLGKVALLRDMINWCIENPVRGKPLHEDDPRMKAMEAYIYAKRDGVKLQYGKH